MRTVVLKDKAQLDFIINSVYVEGKIIEDVKNLLVNKDIERSKKDIAMVLSLGLGLKAKYIFLEEEFNLIKKLYCEYNVGIYCIMSELAKKGYDKDRYAISMLIEDNDLKKGIVFTDEEKRLIYDLYSNDGRSVRYILNKLNNPFRKRTHLEDYIRGSKLQKATLWSDEEICILEQYYEKGGAKLCKENGLKRSNRVIFAKAVSMGLSVGISSKKWANSEDKYLMDNYLALSREELADGLGRSVDSINNRLCRLGLHKNKKWSDSEVDIIHKYYIEGGAKLCIENGLKRDSLSINSKANSLGLYRGGLNMWSGQELSILKEYYPIGGSRLCIEKGLNRSNMVISNKACRLGIKSGVDRKDSVLWSDSDISILKEYYPIGGSKLCIEKGITRDSKSMVSKAYQLGLKAPNRKWCEKDISILKEYYPIGGSNLCRQKGLSRERASIYNKARELGLSVEK